MCLYQYTNFQLDLIRNGFGITTSAHFVSLSNSVIFMDPVLKTIIQVPHNDGQQMTHGTLSYTLDTCNILFNEYNIIQLPHVKTHIPVQIPAKLSSLTTHFTSQVFPHKLRTNIYVYIYCRFHMLNFTPCNSFNFDESVQSLAQA